MQVSQGALRKNEASHIQRTTENNPSFSPLKKMRLMLATLAVGWLLAHVRLAMGDVGTAQSYSPPYLPTKCRGSSREQFPGDGLFIAASDGIWDNGAACGRKYRLRCLSGLKRPCKEDTITVEVVDVCRLDPCPATMVLSNKAFDAISKIPYAKINVEYAQ